MRPRPTPQELKVLHALWDLGSPATVNEVVAGWASGEPPGYTTVLKVLQNMEGKGLVSHKRSGRAYRYTALLRRDAVSRSRLQELLHGFSKGDTVRFVNAFVEEAAMSPQEIREIQKLLSQKARKKQK